LGLSGGVGSDEFGSEVMRSFAALFVWNPGRLS
jgi:hypothetical protein